MQPAANPEALGAAAGAFGLSMLFGLALGVYFAATLMVIAKKTGTPNAWLAWVPIANVFLLCRAARRPGWWALLLCLPGLNLVAAVVIWMGIAAARGREAWTGALILIPVIGFFVPAYLASGPAGGPVGGPAAAPPRPGEPAARPSVAAACPAAASRERRSDWDGPLLPDPAFCAPRPAAGAAPPGAPAPQVVPALVGVALGLGMVGWLAFGRGTGHPVPAPRGVSPVSAFASPVAKPEVEVRETLPATGPAVLGQVEPSTGSGPAIAPATEEPAILGQLPPPRRRAETGTSAPVSISRGAPTRLGVPGQGSSFEPPREDPPATGGMEEPGIDGGVGLVPPGEVPGATPAPESEGSVVVIDDP